MLGKGSSTIWRHSPSVPPTGGFGGSDAATSKFNYHKLNFALQILSWTETAQRGLRCLNAISRQSDPLDPEPSCLELIP
jgi:hypothetical protein